jgi:hypothetical protein
MIDCMVTREQLPSIVIFVNDTIEIFETAECRRLAGKMECEDRTRRQDADALPGYGENCRKYLAREAARANAEISAPTEKIIQTHSRIGIVIGAAERPISLRR